MYPTLPHSPSEIFDLLKKGLLQGPDNVIFYTVKDIFKLNQARCEEAKSKQLATKIWSMANDWQALLLPQKSQVASYYTPSNWPKRSYTNVTYRILSNSAALSNSTTFVIIPPGFFAFKIYSRLSNSPAL